MTISIHLEIQAYLHKIFVIIITRSEEQFDNILYFGSTTSTRGPRGPWVAHLRKRSKVTVKPIVENPRGII